MVQVGRRRGQAGRQPVRDRDRQDLDGSAGDVRRHAFRNPLPGRRDRQGRRRGGGDCGCGRGDGSATASAAACERDSVGEQTSDRPFSSVRPRAKRGPRAKPRGPAGKNWVPASRGRIGKCRSFAYPHMDPFHEVRTPARNFGPARLPGGATVTPLARRLAGERGIDLSRVAGSGPHGRIVAADIDKAAPGAAPAPRLAAQAPRRSRRSTKASPTRKCRSTPCAAPSRRASPRPSRPSRISI